MTASMRLVSVSGQFVCFGRLFSLFGLFWAAGRRIFFFVPQWARTLLILVLGNSQCNHFNGESCKHPLSSDLNKSKSATEAGRGWELRPQLLLLDGTCRMDDNTGRGRILANKLQRNGAHCTQCKRCLHRRQPPPWGVLLEMWLGWGRQGDPSKKFNLFNLHESRGLESKAILCPKNFVHKAAAEIKADRKHRPGGYNEHASFVPITTHIPLSCPFAF